MKNKMMRTLLMTGIVMALPLYGARADLASTAYVDSAVDYLLNNTAQSINEAIVAENIDGRINDAIDGANIPGQITDAIMPIAEAIDEETARLEGLIAEESAVRALADDQLQAAINERALITDVYNRTDAHETFVSREDGRTWMEETATEFINNVIDGDIFATAEQGTRADTALQNGGCDNGQAIIAGTGNDVTCMNIATVFSRAID